MSSVAACDNLSCVHDFPTFSVHECDHYVDWFACAVSDNLSCVHYFLMCLVHAGGHHFDWFACAASDNLSCVNYFLTFGRMQVSMTLICLHVLCVKPLELFSLFPHTLVHAGEHHIDLLACIVRIKLSSFHCFCVFGFMQASTTLICSHDLCEST